MGWLFQLPLASIVTGVILNTHLHRKYHFWIKKDYPLFAKYGSAKRSRVGAAEAYLCKALWLILLILGTISGMDFEAILISTFFLYAAALVDFFRFNRYKGGHFGFAIVALLLSWLPRLIRGCLKHGV